MTRQLAMGAQQRVPATQRRRVTSRRRSENRKDSLDRGNDRSRVLRVVTRPYTSGLELEQAGVRARAGNQLLVTAVLDDHTVLEHVDPVRAADAREAVGDEQRRAALEQLAQALEQLVSCTCVE